MADYFIRVTRHTPTQFWINNVTRAEARLAIAAGATGCTQNLAYLSKALASAEDGEYLRGIIRELLPLQQDDNALTAELQRRAIASICAIFRPMYEQSGGRRGMVSIQADPFSEDVDAILANATASLALAPNFIIKIPVTYDGLKAMSLLMPHGIAVMATEVMSIDQALSVCELHRECTARMKHPAPLWLAHINGIFDEHLAEYAIQNHVDIAPDILRRASLALGRKINGYIRARGYDVNYLAGGARGLSHFTDWVGVSGGVTINWRGTADRLLALDMPAIDAFNAETPYPIIDELLAKLPEFAAAWTPDTLSADEYESFGPVVRFRRIFEKGWSSARQTVASMRNGGLV